MKQLEAWFVTGSQHLYGEETLRQVAADSKGKLPGIWMTPWTFRSILFIRKY
jgi:L-arabinose isomerase